MAKRIDCGWAECFSLAHRMTTAFQREVSPLGYDPAALGERLIRVTQEGNKQFAVMLGQWEMFITYFKHCLEIPLCISKDRPEDLRNAHRTSLVAGMALGEILAGKVQGHPLESLGYADTFIASNLRYLRDTYQQWYGDRDDDLAITDEALIANAPADPPQRDS